MKKKLGLNTIIVFIGIALIALIMASLFKAMNWPIFLAVLAVLIAPLLICYFIISAFCRKIIGGKTLLIAVTFFLMLLVVVNLKLDFSIFYLSNFSKIIIWFCELFATILGGYFGLLDAEE